MRRPAPTQGSSRRPSQGEIRAITGRLQEVVQQGDPDTGWEGDPYLTVEHNQLSGQLNVWDTLFNPPKLVLAKPYDGIAALDTRSLTRRLKEAQHKGQGHQSIMSRLDAREQAREKELKAKRLDLVRELTEEQLWLLKRLDV